MEINILSDLIYKRLEEDRLNIEVQWSKDQNTRFAVIDNLLPDEIVEKIYDAFPKDKETFLKRKSFREKKSTLANFENLPDILSSITEAFQTEKVINAVSSLVNMECLEPDPSLYAGGLSMMFEEDFLNPHIDNSHDASRSRYRRLNLLYYVSPEWELDNGANFELWDKKVKNATTIVSKYNRLVLMETHSNSWHSVSRNRVSKARCCVSNYYFSQNSPSGNDYFHITAFMGRPEEKLKRITSFFDNSLRQTIAQLTKTGRGKGQVRKK
ncbi:2OG-Fe(II) oxygenase [Vibrio fluvialis]|uniref:2OG-Fe(II) oxygenase n=1 Tax=Vibrio fluvialis TaxID=676 RepID=UPI00192AE320|nr:2OG-Fe(II) oxygenase [Vibrio fluvialis]MBL4284411.1 2OG-Fe(II) oxygenase [Vibrio fluvialis]